MMKGFFYSGNDKLAILKDKKALLAEVDGAIARAPVTSKDFRTIYEAIIRDKWCTRCGTVYGFSEAEVRTRAESVLRKDESICVNEIQRPARSIGFEIGGNCKVEVFDEKGYLNEFGRRIAKTPETMKRTVAKAKKTLSFRPVASKQETIETLVKVNRKGWFSDGYLLIKGEIPKDRTKPTGKSEDVSSVMEDMKYDSTQSAELQYYCLNDPDIGNVVSRRPVLQLGMYHIPIVIFRIEDGRYISYSQGKFRVLKNRFPDAEYRINHKMGILAAYEKSKLVACLMLFKSGCEDGDSVFASIPLLEKEAVDAGLLPGKRDDPQKIEKREEVASHF